MEVAFCSSAPPSDGRGLAGCFKMGSMSPTRREFLRSLAGTAALLGLLPHPLAQARERRPNIVLIMADDMGYECVSAYGSALQTPHLDRAASRGILFTQAHSQPLCTPTRVQIMTGYYNHRNYEAFGYLNPKQTTFAQQLRGAGYATCIAGKWQLSGDASTVHSFGFDEHCLWNMHAYREGEGSPSAMEPETWRKRYRDPCLYRNGEWIRPGKDAYGPDVCCDFLLSFIERHRDQPFLAYYPMILVHSPFEPTPHSQDWDAADDKTNTKEKHFADMVAYTDHLVGRIQSKLEELGLMEDTVLLFTGDNGTHCSLQTPQKDGSSLQGGKGLTVDLGTHVPLIAWGKDVVRGVRNDALVDFTDVFPSLLEIAAVASPASLALDGFSLVPILTGSDPKGKRDAVFCFYDPRWGVGRKKRVFARDDRHKLYTDGSFYDLSEDPFENQDLSREKLKRKQKKAKDRLQSILDRYLHVPSQGPTR